MDEAVSNGSYHAFISYAHEDAHVARWLHRSLEAFRLPRGLRLNDTLRRGDAVHPLYPCFLDREELRGGELNDQIVAALQQSHNLIVLCSVYARDSEWVDREVAAFLSRKPVGRVFPVLTGDTGGLREVDLFPNTLRSALQAQHREIGAWNLLATDLRSTGDGARRGLFKIVAGISGILFRDLVARQAERERKRRLIWATAVLVAALAAVQLIATSLETTGNADLLRRVGIAEEQIEISNEADVKAIVDRKLIGMIGGCDALVGVGACGYVDEKLGAAGSDIFLGLDSAKNSNIIEAVTLLSARVGDEIREDRDSDTRRRTDPLNFPEGPSTTIVDSKVRGDIVIKNGERYFYSAFSLPRRDGFIRYAWLAVSYSAIPNLVRAQAVRLWGRAIPTALFLFYAMTEFLPQGRLLRREPT